MYQCIFNHVQLILKVSRPDLGRPWLSRLPTENLLSLNYNQTHQFPFSALNESGLLIASADKKPLFPQSQRSAVCTKTLWQPGPC